MKDKPTFVVECPSCGEEQLITISLVCDIDGIDIADRVSAEFAAKVAATSDPALKEGYRQLADRRQMSANLRKAFTEFTSVMQDELSKR